MEHTLIPSFMFLIPPPPPYPLRSACFPIHILAPSLLSIHSLKVNIYRRLCVQRAITTNLHLSSRYHNTIPNEVLLPAIRCLPPFFYSFTLCVLSNSCVHALCNLNHVIALPPSTPRVTQTFILTHTCIYQQINGHEAVTLLFSSGAYDVFHAKSIAIFGVVFFILTAITTSSALPAGIFVPSMSIGACLGRLLAIFTNTYIKSPLGLTPVDPGPWATIGAAAFMCGSARLTVTIAIIILEITGDFRYIPGIAIAVVFAKMTGGFFTKSKQGIRISMHDVVPW